MLALYAAIVAMPILPTMNDADAMRTGSCCAASRCSAASVKGVTYSAGMPRAGPG